MLEIAFHGNDNHNGRFVEKMQNSLVDGTPTGDARKVQYQYSLAGFEFLYIFFYSSTKIYCRSSHTTEDIITQTKTNASYDYVFDVHG